MPYVVLVVAVFGLGLVLDRRATRQMYLLVAVAAAAVTLYFLRKKGKTKIIKKEKKHMI